MKDGFTKRQIAFTAALMLLGRLSAAYESSVGRDIWLVFLVVPPLALPLIRVFSDISCRETVDASFSSAFGKGAGRLFLLLLCLAAFVLAVGGVGLFNTFISSTPMEYSVLWEGTVIMCATFFITLALPFSAVGKSINFVFPIVAGIMLISVLAALGMLDFGAVLPVAENGALPIVEGSLRSLLLQISPLVFLAFLVKSEKSYRPISAGLGLAFFLLLISHLRNVMLLGGAAVGVYRFPNFIALSQISLGDIFQGMEIFTSQAYVICQPIKSAVCLRFMQESLSALFPATRKAWCIVLPVLCGIAAVVTHGTDTALIQTAAGIATTLIPLLMWVSLSARKII